MIAPPAIYLLSLQAAAKNGVQVAAQNAYFKDSGAFTGEIRYVHDWFLGRGSKLTLGGSPVQLKDAGINWVILGHSERRSYFREDSDVVAKKTDAVSADHNCGSVTKRIVGPQSKLERYSLCWGDFGRKGER